MEPPKGFPSNLTDQELDDFVLRCSNELTRKGVAYDSQTGVRSRELFQISVNEQQRRQLSSLIDQNERSSRVTMKLSKYTIRLTITTILLTGITIWFAYSDYSSDAVWQQEQINTLNSGFNEINETLKEIKSNLVDIEKDSTQSVLGEGEIYKNL